MLSIQIHPIGKSKYKTKFSVQRQFLFSGISQSIQSARYSGHTSLLSLLLVPFFSSHFIVVIVNFFFLIFLFLLLSLHTHIEFGMCIFSDQFPFAFVFIYVVNSVLFLLLFDFRNERKT